MPLLAPLVLLFGCSKNQNEEATLLGLSQKEKALNGRLASMKEGISTERDNINDFFINKSVLLSHQGRQEHLYQNVYIWTSG